MAALIQQLCQSGRFEGEKVQFDAMLPREPGSPLLEPEALPGRHSGRLEDQRQQSEPRPLAGAHRRLLGNHFHPGDSRKVWHTS